MKGDLRVSNWVEDALKEVTERLQNAESEVSRLELQILSEKARVCYFQRVLKDLQEWWPAAPQEAEEVPAKKQRGRPPKAVGEVKATTLLVADTFTQPCDKARPKTWEDVVPAAEKSWKKSNRGLQKFNSRHVRGAVSHLTKALEMELIRGGSSGLPIECLSRISACYGSFQTLIDNLRTLQNGGVLGKKPQVEDRHRPLTEPQLPEEEEADL